MKQLFIEIREIKDACPDLFESSSTLTWKDLVPIFNMLPPLTRALFQSLPERIRVQICQAVVEDGPRGGYTIDLGTVETENIFRILVEAELTRRVVAGSYKGPFQAISYSLPYQARAALPSNFDCDLGYTIGYAAATFITQERTALMVDVTKLKDDVKSWEVFGTPISSLLTFQMADQDESGPQDRRVDEVVIVEGVFSWFAAWMMMLWLVVCICSLTMAVLTFQGEGIERISEERSDGGGRLMAVGWGTSRAVNINMLIAEGVHIYMSRTFPVILLFLLSAGGYVYVSSGWGTLACFCAGAFLNLLSAWIGVRTAVQGTCRLATVMGENLSRSVQIGMYTGSIGGLLSTSLALGGMAGMWFWALDTSLLSGFGSGACLVSFYLRVGGGIFSKGAELGGDLVGEMNESKVDEERRVFELQQRMAWRMTKKTLWMSCGCWKKRCTTCARSLGLRPRQRCYPVAVKGSDNPARGPVTRFCVITGEYFTSPDYWPIRSLATNSTNGVVQVILQGLGQGFLSTATPAILMVLAVIITWGLQGHYGLALLASSSVSGTGFQGSIASFGAIATNAHKQVHLTTYDSLSRNRANILATLGDIAMQAGNTISAINAFSAVFNVALTLLAETYTARNLDYQDVSGSPLSEWSQAGLVLGVVMPFLFTGETTVSCLETSKAFMRFCKESDTVGKISQVPFPQSHLRGRSLSPKATEPVRACSVESGVRILSSFGTITSMRLVFSPIIHSMICPLLGGFFLGTRGLIWLLSGMNVLGVCLSLFLINSGQSWVSARKYVLFGRLKDRRAVGPDSAQYGHLGVGEMIGGPLEDVSGPALNNFVKLVAGPWIDVADVHFTTRLTEEEDPETTWAFGLIALFGSFILLALARCILSCILDCLTKYMEKRERQKLDKQRAKEEEEQQRLQEEEDEEDRDAHARRISGQELVNPAQYYIQPRSRLLYDISYERSMPEPHGGLSGAMGRKQKGVKEAEEGGEGGLQDVRSAFSRLQQMMAMTNPGMFPMQNANPMAAMMPNLPKAMMPGMPGMAPMPALGGAKKEWVIKPGLKPGDWTCPRCEANVYASKFNCWRCGVSKRGENESEYISEHGRIHPDIQELCDAFYVEQRHIEKLNELMKMRTDTWDEDLKKLREVMEKARSPCGMLVTKMKEIEDGTFVAVNRDKRMKYLVDKFKLDKTAETSISDILARCSKEKQEEYYYDLERHFECSGKPSATAMMIMKKMANGEPLGPPGRPGMEAPEHGEGCPEAVGLHGKAAAEALQSGAERVRRELQANLQAMIRKAISEGRPMEDHQPWADTVCRTLQQRKDANVVHATGAAGETDGDLRRNVGETQVEGLCRLSTGSPEGSEHAAAGWRGFAPPGLRCHSKAAAMSLRPAEELRLSLAERRHGFPAAERRCHDPCLQLWRHEPGAPRSRRACRGKRSSATGAKRGKGRAIRAQPSPVQQQRRRAAELWRSAPLALRAKPSPAGKLERPGGFSTTEVATVQGGEGTPEQLRQPRTQTPTSAEWRVAILLLGAAGIFGALLVTYGAMYLRPSSFHSLKLLEKGSRDACRYFAVSIALLGSFQFLLVALRLWPELLLVATLHELPADLVDAFPEGLELNLTNGVLSGGSLSSMNTWTIGGVPFIHLANGLMMVGLSGCHSLGFFLSHAAGNENNPLPLISGLMILAGLIRVFCSLYRAVKLVSGKVLESAESMILDVYGPVDPQAEAGPPCNLTPQLLAAPKWGRAYAGDQSVSRIEAEAMLQRLSVSSNLDEVRRLRKLLDEQHSDVK
eukprot:g4347.t1